MTEMLHHIDTLNKTEVHSNNCSNAVRNSSGPMFFSKRFIKISETRLREVFAIFLFIKEPLCCDCRAFGLIIKT